MAAATGMVQMKNHREMMKRTVTNIYELFQSGQLESLAMLLDKECRLDCNALCDYNPLRGMFKGRQEIREWMIDYRSAVELKQFQWQICEVDEARGTVLIRIQNQGKIRNTDKAFNYMGWDMIQFRNGHVYRMKFWGDDREFAKACKTPATEMVFKIAMAFFNKDMGSLKKLVGNAKMKFFSNGVDPRTGQWSIDQWMEMMNRYDYQYTQRRLVFNSKTHVIIEYKGSQFSDCETGQSLMGHRPEFFRFYIHSVCDDNGRLRECEMHMTPQPSGFLFAKPNGGASRRGLVQHVQHAHVPQQMMGKHAQRAH